MSPQDELLHAAVEQIGAESASARLSGELCELSREHLEYMIQQNAISHDGSSRRNQLIFSIGGTGSGEIVASNCGQSSDADAAQQCANSWEKSIGHRELMRKTWDAACYLMKLGNQGCYYCIGLFANGIKN